MYAFMCACMCARVCACVYLIVYVPISDRVCCTHDTEVAPGVCAESVHGGLFPWRRGQ